MSSASTQQLDDAVRQYLELEPLMRQILVEHGASEHDLEVFDSAASYDGAGSACGTAVSFIAADGIRVPQDIIDRYAELAHSDPIEGPEYYEWLIESQQALAAQ